MLRTLNTKPKQQSANTVTEPSGEAAIIECQFSNSFSLEAVNHHINSPMTKLCITKPKPAPFLVGAK
jgi:hypothetical protein